MAPACGTRRVGEPAPQLNAYAVRTTDRTYFLTYVRVANATPETRLAINHHHVPQVYLQAWCDGPKLVSYLRLPPHGSLSRKRFSPKLILRAPDLNTIPELANANGLKGNDLEQLLAATIDGTFANIRAASREIAGLVHDEELRQQLSWAMRVFSARAPARLTGAERIVAEVIGEQAENIRRMMAQAPDGANELSTFLHPDRPRATALATLASVITTTNGERMGWLNGDIYLISAEAARGALDYLGAGEFVTFDDPVLQWEMGPYGMLASFAVSPEQFLVMVERGRTLSLEDAWDAVLRHCVGAIGHRRQLISRTELRGIMLDRVGTLLWP